MSNQRSLIETVKELFKEKEKVKAKLESRLDKREIERAVKDSHARRKPRPCGMTIHTGVGCSYGCIYCYIWDMGFPGRPRPYPLNGLELAYALAVNPYVVPYRTLAAYGSVTEPFLPETRSRALEYIREIARWLHLPGQASTKTLLSSDIVEEILRVDPGFSMLVTVIAWDDFSRRLEPGAPLSSARLDAAAKALREGLSVTVFMRPIIPGIPLYEMERVLVEAWKRGIDSVVFGSLRVTSGILARLEKAGIRISLDRILGRPTRRRQVYVNVGDLKHALIRRASSLGFRVYPSACAANIGSHGLSCAKCKWGPCNGRPVDPGLEGVREALTFIIEKLNINNINYNIRKLGICKYQVTAPKKTQKKKLELPLYWLAEASYCNITLSHR